MFGMLFYSNAERDSNVLLVQDTMLVAQAWYCRKIWEPKMGCRHRHLQTPERVIRPLEVIVAEVVLSAAVESPRIVVGAVLAFVVED